MCFLRVLTCFSRLPERLITIIITIVDISNGRQDDEDDGSDSESEESQAHNNTNTNTNLGEEVLLEQEDDEKLRANGAPIYEVDYVGTGTFRVSQLNLLSKRSLEPLKSIDAQLSARGLHHRSREVFAKEVQTASLTIAGLMRGERASGTKSKPSTQLFQPHFQRALALERLQQVDKAIADYSMCLRIDDRNAAAHFNRAGLQRVRRRPAAALQDLDAAVRLEPANAEYRTQRALALRQAGRYREAVRDTLLTRALQREPGLARSLQLGGEVALESDLVYSMKLAEDPVLRALGVTGSLRSRRDLEALTDFLKTLKFFQAFTAQPDLLVQVAAQVELRICPKNTPVFEEGSPGHHFFIILDGEVSIVKVKKIFGEVVETKVIVRMFRGQTFGETALESRGGLRTAGALATQNCRLLTLRADEYMNVLRRHRGELQAEVRGVLSCAPLFCDWETSRLDHLAGLAVVKHFGANAEILRAGEPVPSLLMIKSGLVQLIKAVPRTAITLPPRGTGMEEDAAEVPGLWILNKNWNHRLDDSARQGIGGGSAGGSPGETAEFTVGVLGSGEVFGELAVLDPGRPSSVSAMSSTAVELYCFESDVLLAIGARFNPATMQALHESLTLRDPPLDKIAFFFRAKYNWELRKHRLMHRLKQHD